MASGPLLGLLLALHLLQTLGIAIDNEVVGLPLIECSDRGATFNVRTRLPFRGNIYVKGQFGVPHCRQEFYRNDAPGASFGVRIGDCGMRRGRQLQPLGMNYMLVFVVSFHPQFVTKVDRAYNVRCFYAQTERTVNSELEVGMLQTETLEQATMVRPHCEYSIRAGAVDGPRVKFTNIGEQLVHRWECDNPHYGMLVKNCFVNDGGGSTVRVLDERGCPVFSPVVQGALSYDDSLQLAFVPVWAYKFPDRAQLYFQCQIQVCAKRDNECVGITPPNCPSVARPDFVPNSVVQPGVDATQVVGTFVPPTLDPLLAGAVPGNPFTNPFVGPTADALLAPGALRPGRPYRRPEAPLNATTPPTTTRLNPFRRQLRQQKEIEEELREWNIERMRDDLFRKAPLARRLRKAVDETLDVIAEPVFVADADAEAEPGERVFRRAPVALDAEDVVCVNRVALGATVVLFAFVSTTTLVMGLFISYDFYAKRLRKKRTFDRHTIFGFVSSPLPPARASTTSRSPSSSSGSSRLTFVVPEHDRN
ncbi:hypothetical protein QR680_009269 [Steinernema hermaphroditum]|uniref:ZP domain-containing protein n=1 Tax=Steinernema hermaphroditum TaxID=289476 RepID=A0AA39ILR7_9BILA|nr:hypothetical protein QR680_009269 [Steinernema hermaphroditum]